LVDPEDDILSAYVYGTHNQKFNQTQKHLLDFYQGAPDFNTASRFEHEGKPELSAALLKQFGYDPDTLTHFDEALAKHQMNAPSTLWRGLSTRPAGQGSGGTSFLYHEGENLQPGDVLGSKGYVSTSLHPNTAKIFSSMKGERPTRIPMIFPIEAPEGQKGAFVGNGGGGLLSSETEFLMPRHTQFEVAHKPIRMTTGTQPLIVPLRVRQGDPHKDPAGYIAGLGALGALGAGAGADAEAAPDEGLPAYAAGGAVDTMFGGEDLTPYSTDARPYPEELDRIQAAPYHAPGPDVVLPSSLGMDSTAPVTYPEMLKRFGMRGSARFLHDAGVTKPYQPPPTENQVLRGMEPGESPELMQYLRDKFRTNAPVASDQPEARSYTPTIRDWVRQHLSGAPKRAFQNFENSGVKDMIPGADIASILERKYRGEKVDPEEDFGAMLYALPGFKLPMILGTGMGVGSGVARGLLGSE